jgi:hypothetical protein
MKHLPLVRVVLVGLAGVALAACTQLPPEISSVEVGSDPAEEAELEFTGAVDSIGSNSWSIGGLVVGVAASTEVNGSPAIGDLVRVHALVVDDTTLIAREIGAVEQVEKTPVSAVETPAPGEEIEFFGPVMNIAADSWTVGDRVVHLTSNTEVKGTIVAGDPVKVHALVQADGSLTAREIEPATQDDLTSGDDDLGDDDFSDDEDLEVKGVVTSIQGDTWTVAGVTFVVPSGTDIDGSVQVGDTVEIHAVWSAEGVLTATRIHLEDGPGDDGEDDLDGDSDDADDDDLDDDSDDADDDDDNSGPGGGDDDNSGSGGGDDSGSDDD